MLVRRRGLAAATLCVAFATRAQAKDYPTHPVRIVSDSATTRRACDRSAGSDVAVTSRKAIARDPLSSWTRSGGTISPPDTLDLGAGFLDRNGCSVPRA
jgi:hypothetical protein